MLRDISLHIMDLSQNSIRAEAKMVRISLVAEDGFLNVSIEDNGLGMDKDYLKKVEDPFTTERTTRKVGMGIPFFKQACLTAEGDFSLQSELNQGTTIKGSFMIKSIDRIPLGDIGETIKYLIINDENIRYILDVKKDCNEFQFDTDVIKETLEGVPINQQEILEWIKEYINDNVSNIFGGVLDEIPGRT